MMDHLLQHWRPVAAALRWPTPKVHQTTREGRAASPTVGRSSMVAVRPRRHDGQQESERAAAGELTEPAMAGVAERTLMSPRGGGGE
jgi:hypothetical protein